MRSAKDRPTTNFFPRYRTMHLSDTQVPANVLLIDT